MGGINPNKGVKPLDGFVKTWTRFLWDINTSFYHSHSSIESACLIELIEHKVDNKAIVDSRENMANAASSIQAWINYTNDNVNLINEEGTWAQRLLFSTSTAITIQSFVRH